MNEIAKLGYGRAENVARLRDRDGGRSSFWLGCVADHLANWCDICSVRTQRMRKSRPPPRGRGPIELRTNSSRSIACVSYVPIEWVEFAVGASLWRGRQTSLSTLGGITASGGAPLSSELSGQSNDYPCMRTPSHVLVAAFHFPMQTCLPAPPGESTSCLPRIELGATSTTPGATSLPTSFKLIVGEFKVTLSIFMGASLGASITRFSV